jgi:hypothetical protein
MMGLGKPLVSTLGFLAGVVGAAVAGVVRQWMAAPGVYVNGEATSRQWMTPAGTYVN